MEGNYARGREVKERRGGKALAGEILNDLINVFIGYQTLFCRHVATLTIFFNGAAEIGKKSENSALQLWTSVQMNRREI